MKYENQYDKFLDKKRTVNFDKNRMIQKNVRLPEDIWKLINDELRQFEDAGQKISYNDYVVYWLMTNLNINQNEKGEWKTGNKMSLNYHIKQK
jgi:hypothetical protein